MNCKYCGEAIIPCPKQPCGLGEYLHGESGLHRCNQGLTATPEPVAPAPTARRMEWLNELLMCVGEAWSDYGFNGDIYRHVWTDRKKAEEILEAYASSQSEKLAGVGQQAAEEIQNVGNLHMEWGDQTYVEVAEIIDRVIAGRVKP